MVFSKLTKLQWLGDFIIGAGLPTLSTSRDAAEIVDRQQVAINPQVNDAETSPDEHRDAIPDELVWALAGTDSNQRLDAIDSLAQIDNHAVVGLLQLASFDASADVRSLVVARDSSPSGGSHSRVERLR